MRYQHDPDGWRLPIKLDETTNGEFAAAPAASPTAWRRTRARWSRSAATRAA